MASKNGNPGAGDAGAVVTPKEIGGDLIANESPSLDHPAHEWPESCLEAALAYAARGWLVFPVPPGTKRSYKSAKYSDGVRWGASRDTEQIKRDWARWPNANIGIPTGAENGFFVIETDTVEGHGVDGAASLKKWEDEYGPLPETLMAMSPSGSIHRYYKHPGSAIKFVSRSIAPGVDIKGDGGMVIAPPSLVPGKSRYRWVNHDAN